MMGTSRVWGTAAGIAPRLIHSATPRRLASSTADAESSRQRKSGSGPVRTRMSCSPIFVRRRVNWGHSSVAEWISLGAIPAAVPHTRDVPIMGTESAPGLLRANVTPGPDGILRVPAAAISVLDHAIARAGIPAVGYFAQVPHYVTGAYVPAALELLRVLSRHLGREVAPGALRDESRQVLERLDVATAADEGTRAYVERLEATVDEARRPSGDDLISEIERFLRESGQDGGRDPGGRGSAAPDQGKGRGDRDREPDA